MRALRAEALVTWLVAAAGVAGLAVAARARLPLGPLFPLKALLVVAVTAALAMRGLERHHPFETLGAANRITTFRTVLIALIVASVGESPAAGLSLAIACVAVVALAFDGVDGWLARRSSMASRYGARFDMEIDAVLVMALAVLVWRHDRTGAWVLLAGLWRYLFVAAGWVLPWMRQPLPPAFRRQATCVLQIVGLVVAMLPFVPAWAQTWSAALTLATLSVSFLVDIAWLYGSDRREQVA